MRTARPWNLQQFIWRHLGNVSAIPYGSASQGQALFATGTTTAEWGYSAWDSSTVTAAAGTGAGTTPPAPVLNSASTITRGALTCGTGSSAATGTLATITFGATLPTVPFVMVTATNSATAALYPAVSGISTTGFSVLATSPSSSQTATTYAFGWLLSL